MDDAPIPRHERTWRHPSELSAPPVAYVEPNVRGRQLTALAAGALVAIGVVGLLATFAPTTGAPTAVSSTTTPPVQAIATVTEDARRNAAGLRSPLMSRPNVSPLRATFDPATVVARIEPRPFEKVLVLSDVDMFYMTWHNLQHHGGLADSIVVNMRGQVVARCDGASVTVLAASRFDD